MLADPDADPDLGLDLAGVELRLGQWATGIDRARKVLITDAGEVDYDVLVLATGAAPIVLPGDGPQVTLRTREDAAGSATACKGVPGSC